MYFAATKNKNLQVVTLLSAVRNTESSLRLALVWVYFLSLRFLIGYSNFSLSSSNTYASIPSKNILNILSLAHYSDISLIWPRCTNKMNKNTIEAWTAFKLLSNKSESTNSSKFSQILFSRQLFSEWLILRFVGTLIDEFLSIKNLGKTSSFHLSLEYLEIKTDILVVEDHFVSLVRFLQWTEWCIDVCLSC